jgi:hypothetical protein
MAEWRVNTGTAKGIRMSDSEKERNRMLRVAQQAADRLNARFGEPRRHTESGAADSPARKIVDSVTQQPGRSIPSLRQRKVATPIPQRGPVPPTLYKYLERKYAESLVQRGNIVVGTLHSFRDEEKFGLGIGDRKEGKKNLTTTLNATFVGGTPEADALRQFGIIIDSPDSSITFVDSYFDISVDHSDAYVWCSSGIKSADAMAKVDKADTCVEIFDVPGFYQALNEAMLRRDDVSPIGPQTVIYHDLVEAWNGQDMGEHPLFMKGTLFADQGEVRVGWIPRSKRSSPLERQIFDTTDVHKFCHIVTL